MHSAVLWISLFAYAVHIFEEKVLDWKSWSEHTLKLKTLEWSDFYVANAAVIVGGLCCAMVGWQAPAFSLILPALQIINALFFHIIPTFWFRRFSPGVISALCLFLPIGCWCYITAYNDNVLTVLNFIFSLFFGILVMITPFIFLRIKSVVNQSPKQ